jgi:Zn-dependent protease
MMWVALAGPATNLILAALFTVLWKSLALFLDDGATRTEAGAGQFIVAMLTLMAQAGIVINIALAVFNALPFPPLDGGRVMIGLLPHPLSSVLARIEPFGFVILIVLLMTRTLDSIIGPPMGFLLKLYLGLF